MSREADRPRARDRRGRNKASRDGAGKPSYPSLDDPNTLRNLVEKIDEAIWVSTPEGELTDGNAALVRTLGAETIDDLRGRRFTDFLVDRDIEDEVRRRVASGDGLDGIEFEIAGVDGTRRWVRGVSYAVHGAADEIVARQGMLVDLSGHQQAVRALRDSEEKYRSIFENVQDIYYMTDMEGTIVEVSPAAQRYLGYEREELIGMAAQDLYPEPEHRETLRERVLADGEVTDYEVALEHHNGTRIWFSVNARLIRDEHGDPVAFEGLLRDITERKELERRLAELSVRDPLTGCYNRRFLESLRTRLERPTSRWGCLLLDLDNFKAINDTYGHEEGDRVLQGVAHFIRRHGRAQDVVVRLGGDEFAVFVGADSPEELESIAERLREVSPFESPAPFSLGYAFRELGERIEDVVARADRSMYAHKRRDLDPPASA